MPRFINKKIIDDNVKQYTKSNLNMAKKEEKKREKKEKTEEEGFIGENEEIMTKEEEAELKERLKYYGYV